MVEQFANFTAAKAFDLSQLPRLDRVNHTYNADEPLMIKPTPHTNQAHQCRTITKNQTCNDMINVAHESRRIVVGEFDGRKRHVAITLPQTASVE